MLQAEHSRHMTCLCAGASLIWGVVGSSQAMQFMFLKQGSSTFTENECEGEPECMEADEHERIRRDGDLLWGIQTHQLERG